MAIVGLVIGCNLASLWFGVLAERMKSEAFRFASFTLPFVSLLILLTRARWLLWL